MEKKLTVNEALALLTMLRSRVNDLRNLRNTVSTKERYFGYGTTDKEKVVEPQYDVKIVDKKVTELETSIFHIDASIKQANAKTEIEYIVDVGKLLEPLV